MFRGFGGGFEFGGEMVFAVKFTPLGGNVSLRLEGASPPLLGVASRYVELKAKLQLCKKEKVVISR